MRSGTTCQNCRQRRTLYTYKNDYFFDTTRHDFFAERREFDEACNLVRPPKDSSAPNKKSSSSVLIDVSMPMDVSMPAPGDFGRFCFSTRHLHGLMITRPEIDPAVWYSSDSICPWTGELRSYEPRTTPGFSSHPTRSHRAIFRRGNPLLFLSLVLNLARK